MHTEIRSYDAQAFSNGAVTYSVGPRRSDRPRAKPVLRSPFARYKYARFELAHEKLSKEGEARLQALGVECLMEGRGYEAYGIVIDDDVVRELLRRDPEIAAVEDEEPPAGK